MTLIFLVVSILLVSADSQQLHEVTDVELHHWELFKVEHMKEYGSDKEDIERRKIFLDNFAFVRDHNAKYLKGKTTFEVEINKFADMTIEEFSTKMNGIKRPPNWVPAGDMFQESSTIQKLPLTVDWRKEGAVTPVKDQIHCSSCWAFSATGSLEGHNFIKTRELASLSEQNLLDCSKAEGNLGCQGGLMDQAFRYIKDNDGIDTETSYPYEARDGTCRYIAQNRGASVRGHVDIPSEDEDKLQVAVALKGPVSAAIDSSYRSFQFYRSGVYTEERCSSDDIDHGVIVVGYGNVTKGGDYWLVKNSWGTGWGMQGYVMMARNLWNMCGIATMASFPSV